MPGGGDRGRVRNSDGSQFRDCRAEEGPRRDDQQTAYEEGYDVVIEVSGFGPGEFRGPHDRRCAECGNHEHRKIEQDGHSREQQLAVGARAGAGTSDRPGHRFEQQVSQQRRTERDRKEHSRAGEHIPDRRGLQTPQAAETACCGAQAVPVVLNPLDEARRDLGNRREHAPADAWIELVDWCRGAPAQRSPLETLASGFSRAPSSARISRSRVASSSRASIRARVVAASDAASLWVAGTSAEVPGSAWARSHPAPAPRTGPGGRDPGACQKRESSPTIAAPTAPPPMA